MSIASGRFATDPSGLWRTASGLFQRPGFLLAAAFCAFMVAFYFAYAYGMGFASENASPFWLPDSILLCALLRSPRRYWWMFLVAPLPIRLFTNLPSVHPLWFLLGAYGADSSKALISALLLRRVLPIPVRLESFRDLGWFALVSALIVPAGEAFVGAWLRNALGQDFWPAWSQWFMGDALAQIVVTPALITLISFNFATARAPNLVRAAEILVTFGGLAVSCYVSMRGNGSVPPALGPLFYLPVPFLYWAAIRFGMMGASIAIPVFAVFSLNAANAGGGPFAGYPPGQLTVVLQNFLVFRCVPVYLVAMLIEQRNRTEVSLAESEARFRVMANSAPVLMWMSGLDRLCTFFNQGWLEFTGRSMDAEMGNGWIEGVHPDDTKNCVAAYTSAFDARRPFEIEYRLRRHDGEYRWILDIGVARQNSEGEFAGYIGCAIDITERRQAAENIRHFAHVQRVVQIGELSAAIAHEVRQPLNAIRLHAKTVEKLLQVHNAPFGEVGEIVADIEKDATRADEIIDRIRKFLRRSDPTKETFDLNAAATEAAQLVSDDARMRRAEIEVVLSPGILRVVGDRPQIMQVLLNLMLNGLESMEGAPPGQRLLTLRTQRRGHFVEVSVTDRGTGISPEAMPQLFESFFTTRSGGMGLGLSIAKSIVDAHNGRIRAENGSDGGAVFYVSLPVLDG